MIKVITKLAKRRTRKNAVQHGDKTNHFRGSVGAATFWFIGAETM
jgi:hypothetical protein